MWPFRSPEKEKPTKRTPFAGPNADLLAEIFAEAPTEAPREPEWLDPAAPRANLARPYLELGEGELERHARDEEHPNERGPALGPPSASRIWGP